MAGSGVHVALQRQLAQPAPNHEGLAMHAAAFSQVLDDRDEDMQPGLQNGESPSPLLATTLAIEFRGAWLACVD